MCEVSDLNIFLMYVLVSEMIKNINVKIKELVNEIKIYII